MAYKKFVFFPTFEEAKAAQEYDHLYQKAVGLATVSGIDLSIIRENNLHILQDGVFPLESYIVENNVAVIDQKLYEYALKYWKITTAWAIIYKYGESFIYLKDHSDRTYNTIEITNNADLKALNDDRVYIPATDWEKI